MEVAIGALPNIIAKLGELLIGEYNLQKKVKGEIRFLQSELESMQGALEKVSNTPIDQIDNQDKIWARELRELSYDIEDSIDTFMVHCMGNELAKLHGIDKFIDRCVGLFRKAMMHRWISTEIIDMKSRVEEVAKRHDRYKINTIVAKPVTIDPRLFAQYKKVTELVGIEEAREEVIQILMEGNEVSKQQVKIVSIVGIGGLGKTTLANVVYEKLRAKFQCSSFVSISRTPDLEKLLKYMFYQLAKKSNETNNVTGELREFLKKKTYLIVVDDIWDIPAWEMIRCALPDNDVGYTIITTTRISDIAEQAGGAYKLKPLSFNNSRKLLYRRIFGNENHDHDEGTEKYPDDELAEISDKILKKCAGVPLAIITMASLLACKARNKMEWYEVYNSIGTGLKNNLDVKNMRKILSFSYYELPCHLKTCLLYLSVFPEDFEIEKDRLIKMWIAEGFIQCRIQAKSLFELGESYLNEIINRSMIQPICNETDGMMYTCRVHDMVLDLIRSLSSEENFAVIRSDMDPSQSNTIRRLSLQNGMENDIMAHTTISLQQARSVVVFPPVVSLAPALGSCRILRVMDLEGCNVSKYTSSLNKYIRSLRQLRYLGLRRTHIDHLPEEIGNLKFLQTLDARGNEISSLPSGIVQLRNLIFLHIDLSTRVPNGIGNLRGLEQLSWLDIDGSNVNIVEDLRQLTEMRRLWIRFDEWNDKLLECLRKLEKIQELLVMVRPGHRSIGGLDTWVAPRHLRELSTQNGTWFSVLPAWVSPWLLTDLSHLFIAVKELHQPDLEILGKLPVLCCLSLEVDNLKLEILGGFVVGAGLFPCLVHCEFLHFVWPVIFQQGAMPRLRDLKLEPIHVGEARQITNRVGGLDLGLGYLPSLQSVLAYFLYESASKKEAEEAEAVLLHAAETHPNDPRHCVYIFDKSTKMTSSSSSRRLKRSMELLDHEHESKKMNSAHLCERSEL